MPLHGLQFLAFFQEGLLQAAESTIVIRSPLYPWDTMSQKIATIGENQRKLSYRSTYPVPADGAYNEQTVNCWEAVSAVAQVSIRKDES